MLKPAVPEVLSLVRRLYAQDDPCTRDAGCVGGHLHIVLDDGNVEDGHVAFCLTKAQEDGCTTCITLAGLLMRMSKTQRSKLSEGAYRAARIR